MKNIENRSKARIVKGREGKDRGAKGLYKIIRIGSEHSFMRRDRDRHEGNKSTPVETYLSSSHDRLEEGVVADLASQPLHSPHTLVEV